MPSIPTREFIKNKKPFEAWHAQHPGGSPIPDQVWKLVSLTLMSMASIK
jgi:hypothetical protein